MNITNTQSRVCYGYSRNALGQFVENNSASIVRQIFSLYLSGHSLRSIVNWLEENQIPSPSGKELWTPKAIDKLLSNETYCKGIITTEQFTQVQIERQRRSNQMQTEEGHPVSFTECTEWAFCLWRMRPQLPSNYQARRQHRLEMCEPCGTWKNDLQAFRYPFGRKNAGIFAGAPWGGLYGSRHSGAVRQDHGGNRRKLLSIFQTKRRHAPLHLKNKSKAFMLFLMEKNITTIPSKEPSEPV